ncbi:hypothetical protein DDE05_30655 [Streptomyces cavourensis]|nr:hypothetical protein DDE05_30655 [Streptomyces cavourensis]
MQRLYDFLRRHPTGVDVFWAVVLLGLSGMSLASGMYVSRRETLLAIPVALGLSTVVALRRRLPEKMLLLAIAVGLCQLLFDVRPGIGNFAMLVITFTVATIGERWASRLALVCSLSAAALSQLRWPAEPGGSWPQQVFVTVIMTVPFVLAWVMGDSLRTRRAYFSQLEERAARLEREREAQSKVAVAAERARPGQLVVGFAAETDDVLANGRAKLRRKGCDLLVVNEVGERKTFGSEENEAVVLGADGTEAPVPYGLKEALADTVWDLVSGRLREM